MKRNSDFENLWFRLRQLRWHLPAIVLGVTLLLTFHALVSSSSAQEEAAAPTRGGQGDRSAAPQVDPLMPPERELAMKIKAPFTFAGVGDIIDRHPIGQLADPGFQGLVQHIRDADASLADMEGTLIDFDNFPNPIGGGAPKAAIADIKGMGIKMMTTANNHTLDGGTPGLFETIKNLDEGGIVHAGTGRDLQDARAASYLSTPKGTVGLVAIFSIDPSSGPGPALTSAATYRNGNLGGAPGLNGLHVTPYFNVTSEQMDALRKIRDSVYARRGEVPDAVPPVAANENTDRLQLFGIWYKVSPKPGDVSYVMNPEDEREILRSIRNGKENSDFMVVTIHCHQANYAFQQYTFDNDVPDFLVELAHKAIDNGADAFVGHGVHTIRGVEIYKGKPIFYGVSNFLYQLAQSAEAPNPGGDTTASEANYRPGTEMNRVNQPDNLENLLVTAHYEGGKLTEARLYPGDLGRDGTRPFSQLGIPVTPTPDVAKDILAKVQRLSKPFGTTISIENNVGVIHVTSAGASHSEGEQGAGK